VSTLSNIVVGWSDDKNFLQVAYNNYFAISKHLVTVIHNASVDLLRPQESGPIEAQTQL